MKTQKRFVFILLFCGFVVGNLFFNLSHILAAGNETVNLYFFLGNGCPHCAKEEVFLQQLTQKYPEVKIYSYEVWYNAQNQDLLIQVGQTLKTDIQGVPFTVIGPYAISGYYDEKTTGVQIENYVKECLSQKCTDPIAPLVGLAPIVSVAPTITPQITPQLSPTPTLSPLPTIKAYFFESSGCPLCKAEKKYLENLKDQYPSLQLESLELSKKENLEIFKKTLDKFQLENAAIPFLVIGENYILGWKDEATTGKAIQDAINCAIETGCPDVVGNLMSSINLETSNSVLPEVVEVPLIGEVKIKNLSLPILAIILGGIDGFNPCAMWVLVFLISLLLGMKDRKRMWILGFVFLFTSAIVYLLFMAAWLKLILFVGAIFWVRLIIALIAVIGGAYNIKKFFEEKNKTNITCEVVDEKQKRKTIERMKAAVKKQSLFWAVIGIVILAASVNLVDLVCSAGLPVVFTQVLAMSHLSSGQYIFYMLLYIIMYMLDDMIIFVAAMTALKITAKSNQYTRYSHLVGGILMIIIGLLLIFKPAWLMFG